MRTVPSKFHVLYIKSFFCYFKRGYHLSHQERPCSLQNVCTRSTAFAGYGILHSVPVQVVPSPVKPGLHAHVKLPGMLLQAAFDVTVVSIQSTFIIIYNMS